MGFYLLCNQLQWCTVLVFGYYTSYWKAYFEGVFALVWWQSMLMYPSKNYVSGFCGGRMQLLQFLDIINALTCLWKLRQIKLLENTTMPLLIFRLNFTKRKVWPHILRQNFPLQVVGGTSLCCSKLYMFCFANFSLPWPCCRRSWRMCNNKGACPYQQPLHLSLVQWSWSFYFKGPN